MIKKKISKIHVQAGEIQQVLRTHEIRKTSEKKKRNIKSNVLKNYTKVYLSQKKNQHNSDCYLVVFTRSQIRDANTKDCKSTLRKNVKDREDFNG